MPPIKKIQKEDIINKAYEIVKCEGYESLNARRLAKELNCSIQPIFHNFSNMQELKDTVMNIIFDTYHGYMKRNLDSKTPYRQLGINYIDFAKNEPVLFKILFMTSTNLTPNNFIEFDSSFQDVEKYAGACTKLSNDEIKQFHIKMWIFTHGIASLVASKTCEFTDSQINDLLVEEYQALMKLEGE